MPTTEQGQQPIDFTSVRDVATVIFKHKYKILATFTIVFMTVAVIALFLPRPYEAKSVLLVKYGREFLQRPEEPKSGSGPSIPPQAIMSGEIRILTSRDVLTKVVKALGPENLYPKLRSTSKEGTDPTQAAVQVMEKDLSVTNLPNSNLIEVVFAHQNRAMAAKALNLLVDAFKEKHLEVFSGAGTPFLENQLRASQEKLNAAETEFAAFRQKYGVFSFEEQRSNLIGQRSTVDGNLRTAQNLMIELQQRAAWVRSPEWTPNAILETRAPLTALEQKERELLEKFSPTSRAVLNIRQDMELTKGSILKNIEVQRQAELQKIEGELSVVRARVGGLDKQSRRLEAEILSLDSHGRRLSDLKREVAEYERSYQAYARKLEESEIIDDMDRRKMVAISVVENASPISTRKKLRYSMERMVASGFVAGILAGVTLAFLLEVLGSGMTLPRGAERRLGLPVMVAVTRKRLAQSW